MRHFPGLSKLKILVIKQLRYPIDNKTVSVAVARSVPGV
jgi:hypothetical protein